MVDFRKFLGVNQIAGFKPPLPSCRIIHPAQGETIPPVKWLQIGTEYVGGEALSLLLYSANMFRDLQDELASGLARVCFSLDGVKPHDKAPHPMSLLCAECPRQEECLFCYTLFVQDEASGLAGLWTLRGMAANRFSMFMSVFTSEKARKEMKFPLRITVRPSIVSAQKRLFNVPQFGVNTSTRLSEKERETAIQVLEDRYDLNRLAMLESPTE